MIASVHLRLLSNRKYSSIRWGAKKRAKLRALPKFPRKGVLTRAAADQKNVHACVFSMKYARDAHPFCGSLGSL